LGVGGRCGSRLLSSGAAAAAGFGHVVSSNLRDIGPHGVRVTLAGKVPGEIARVQTVPTGSPWGPISRKLEGLGSRRKMRESASFVWRCRCCRVRSRTAPTAPQRAPQIPRAQSWASIATPAPGQEAWQTTAPKQRDRTRQQRQRQTVCTRAISPGTLPASVTRTPWGPISRKLEGLGSRRASIATPAPGQEAWQTTAPKQRDRTRQQRQRQTKEADSRIFLRLPSFRLGRE
jgi:hypothetical protein